MLAKKNPQGFSLVELMVVVAIGLVLTAMALPTFFQGYRQNRLNSSMIDFSNLVQRTRYEAVRANQSIACRAAAGLPLRIFVDINGNNQPDINEPVWLMPSDYQFNPPGAPGTGSMNLGNMVLPPGRITFNARGTPDYSAAAPGMNLAGGTLFTTLGNPNRPSDGYRAITVSQTGKLTIWRAQAGGVWTHTQ